METVTHSTSCLELVSIMNELYPDGILPSTIPWMNENWMNENDGTFSNLPPLPINERARGN